LSGATSAMKAVLIERFGGPEVLEVKEVAAATATNQQKLVGLAGGVNFADIMTPHGGWAAQGYVRPIVGHVLPMEKAAMHIAYCSKEKNFGKVVLTIH
jgi:NADPH:quinone reductase-like Zn-dependent oxidoreductase